MLSAPSTPKDLKMTVENATVVYVSWVKPENLNGYLSTILYRISFGPQNGNNSQDVFVQHNIVRSPQNFTLRELAADTVYMVRVYAGRRRKDGIERWSRAVSKQITTMQLGKNFSCTVNGCNSKERIPIRYFYI